MVDPIHIISIKTFMKRVAVARHGLILSQHGATVITMLLDTSLTTCYAISNTFLTRIVKNPENYKNARNLAIFL